MRSVPEPSQVARPVNIRYASLTDVGVKRSHNQDACASQPAADEVHWKSHGHVFVVADGMGGHAVGEKASARAVRDIPLTYLKHVAADGVPAAIRRAFEEANQSIHQIGQNNPEFKGLGTTGTAVVIRPEGAWVGHVGDSRAYRIRGNRIQQLTFDHSWVWEVARRQGIDPDELGDFKRNVIIRSLGPDAAVEVDIEGPYPLEPGDIFLICSDGLTNEVTAEEIGAVARCFGPDDASRYLIDLANVRGGRDNITCLIVHVPRDETGYGKLNRTGLVKLLGRRAGGVPWPFFALGAGALLAAGSVGLKLSEMHPAAVPVFVVAAGLILAGLIGLYSYLRGRADPAGTANGPALPGGALHLYRDYPFDFGPALVERFAKMDATLAEACRARPEAAVDWPSHDGLVTAADTAAARSDWPAAFAARFQAMHRLAAASLKTRAKGEGFEPKWT